MNHERHEKHERHENDLATTALGMRVPSPLSPEAELAMTRTIGCAIAVHKALGPGFLESIYMEAMCIELEMQSDDIHRAQVISYLRTTGLRGGLLLNFRVAVLPKGGIVRIVL